MIISSYVNISNGVNHAFPHIIDVGSKYSTGSPLTSDMMPDVPQNVWLPCNEYTGITS